MIFNLIKHAKQLLYSNIKSKSKAVNVQDAIDEALFSVNDIVEYLGKSKNLLNHTITITEKNGLTFTVNEDKSITVSGIATADTTLTLARLETHELEFNESVIFSGCPSGGNTETYCMMIQLHHMDMTVRVTYDIGEGYTLDADEYPVYLYSLAICVKSGQVMDNVVFKPMIRLASETSEYEPNRGVDRVASIETQVKQIDAELDTHRSLGVPTKSIKEGDDLDNYLTAGTFKKATSSLTVSNEPNGGILGEYKLIVEHLSKSTYIKHTIILAYSSMVYERYRYYSDGWKWSSWKITQSYYGGDGSIVTNENYINYGTTYAVVNGICFITLNVKVEAVSTNWVTICKDLPVPVRKWAFNSDSFSANAAEPLSIEVDDIGQLNIAFGSTGYRYMHTLFYPIA